MTSPQETYTYTDREERLMDERDSQGFTADDVRRELGMHPDESVTVPDDVQPFMSPSDHKPATRKAAARLQYADGPSIETPNGLPHYDNQDPPLPPEQAERNRYYIANLKEIGAEAVRLHAILDDVEADIAATTKRHDDLEIGHPIRGRESNRLYILGEQRKNTIAKLQKLGENIE